MGLDHPNLVRVLEAGAGYLAMERVDGPSLARSFAAARGSGLRVATALLVGERLLEALAYAHGRTGEDGRSLRDRPSRPEPRQRAGQPARRGEARRLRHRPARAALARTRTGVIKGTVQYMAPEQILGGDADPRTDLYGVGLLLFEMLTGRPFSRASGR